MLYIVATPIGNLEDVTMRALRILKEVDVIAAEDTRHVQILLNKYEIRNQTLSFHAHSNDARLLQIVEMLREGKSVALVSDAGTPGISDPGYKLIRMAKEHGIRVVPVPGCSAVITALCASGLSTHQFVYLGFLPLKKGRKTLLDSLVDEKRTIVFYESPHRILKSLNELAERFGDRKIVIGRELTKIYEDFLEGNAAELIKHFEQKKPKGEFVVMIGAAE